MAFPIGNRPRSFYCALILLPVATFLVLLLMGRIQALVHAFHTPVLKGSVQADALLWTFFSLWLSMVPLTLAARNLARRRAEASSAGGSFISGIRDVWRLALGGDPRIEHAAVVHRPPTDRVWVAAVWGICTAIAMPVLFMSLAAQLRTQPAMIWLWSSGALMGAATYCERRGGAYLVDIPPPFGLFRQFRLLNPARYSEPGRPFVRAQMALAVLMPIWWLGGAVWALARHAA
jgi:hypothetical protein